MGPYKKVVEIFATLPRSRRSTVFTDTGTKGSPLEPSTSSSQELCS